MQPLGLGLAEGSYGIAKGTLRRVCGGEGLTPSALGTRAFPCEAKPTLEETDMWNDRPFGCTKLSLSYLMENRELGEALADPIGGACFVRLAGSGGCCGSAT